MFAIVKNPQVTNQNRRREVTRVTWHNQCKERQAVTNYIIVVGDKIVWTGRSKEDALGVRDALVKAGVGDRPAVYELYDESERY